MRYEIERKFLVKPELMRELKNITPRIYERYFLDSIPGTEERIQKVNDKFIYEKKTEVSTLERIVDVKEEISEGKFEELKQSSWGPIVREKFDIAPNVSILFYPSLGLCRAEVEFNSLEEAKAFVPFEWMGEEITNLPIARDKKLLNLSIKEIERMKKSGF